MPKPNETEDAIAETLEKRMDFDGDESTTDAPAGSEGSATPETAPAEGAGEVSKPTAEAGATADTGTAPPAPDAGQAIPDKAQSVERTPRQHPIFKEYSLDKDGNITDKAGTVIASAGQERRWFETSETMRDYIVQQQQYTGVIEANLRTALESGKEALDGVPTRLGLTRDETDLGLKLSANFKTDPVATAKYILAETLKLGYNLDQIVELDGPNSINMRAITQLIDERLGPVGRREEEQRSTQAAQDGGVRAYQEFMTRFPDAAPHQDAIAAIAKQNNVTPERAYFELKMWAVKQGLDFSKPLQEQRATPPATVPSMAAPLPAGGNNAAAVTDTPQIASAEDDYESIIKGAMRDAGMAT